MKFTVKKSLIGMAALSLLAPVASHADTTKGQWINDGLGRSTKDGRGSTCVSSGGPDHAFDAVNCASSAEELKAAAEAERAARKAAQAEAAAAAQAAREEAMMAVEPGSALKPGEKGAYVSHGASAPIRDGFGRSCVKDGRWTPGMSTPECDPDLYSLYKSRKTQVAQPELAPRLASEPPEAERAAPGLQQSELAPRLPYTAQEADRSVVFAPFVPPPGADDPDDAGDAPAEALAEDQEVTPDMMLSDADRTLPEDSDDAAMLAAAPIPEGDDDDEVADDKVEDLAEDEEVTPDMMLSEADRTLPDGDGDDTTVLAAVPFKADDDDEDEADDERADDLAEDEEVTPDMMLSEADRTLDGDDDTAMLAAVVPAENEDEADDTAASADAEDEDTTPDMMLAEADRQLDESEQAPLVAALDDTAPGVAPPPEKKVEDKPIVDNAIPEFPVTKYELAQADTEPKQPAAAQPAALPVTINVQDGLFDFDKADLKSELISKLDSVAAMLRDAKVEAIKIVGHADPIGSAEYNQGLSERRAASAKRYLVSKGIDAGRISTSGAGENDLVATREDCAGKRKQDLIDCLQPNRRVVVEAAGIKTK